MRVPIYQSVFSAFSRWKVDSLRPLFDRMTRYSFWGQVHRLQIEPANRPVRDVSDGSIIVFEIGEPARVIVRHHLSAPSASQGRLVGQRHAVGHGIHEVTRYLARFMQVISGAKMAELRCLQRSFGPFARQAATWLTI